MKTLGITIGIGSNWKGAATRAAMRMQENTGIECIVLDEDPIGLSNPSWLKAFLIDLYPKYDRLMIFDADLIPLQKWNAKEIIEEAGELMVGVVDTGDGVKEECINYGLDPEAYINGGLLITGPHHKKLWERVKRGYPRYGRWLEQTALNKAVQTLSSELYTLGSEYNHIFTYWKNKLDVDKVTDGKIKNFHLASLGGDANALMQVQDILWDIIDKRIEQQ
jgi:hypothetical protein